MKLYRTIDSVGSSCIHWAVNEEDAITKHLVHFSLIGIDEEVKVEELEGREADLARPSVCMDIYCNSKEID